MMTVRERVEHLRMAELMTFQPKTDEPTPPPEDVPAERGEARPHVVAERELCLLIVQHVDIANQPAVFGAIAALVSALAAPAAPPETDDKHREHYRAGYSAGWSDGRNGSPMEDERKCAMFFGPELHEPCRGLGCDACQGTGEKPIPVLAAPAAGEAAPDKQLNGWRELGQEMERILTFMTIRQREDLCPDWFIPRLLEMLTASPGHECEVRR